MNHPYDVVLFDLDGTLCETGDGITASICCALREMGRPVPDDATLRRFIGPPLWDSYKTFCGMTQQEAEEGVRRFRAYYHQSGWLQSRLYPGIQGLLESLHGAGVRVAVATSKPEETAKRILDRQGVLRLFDAVAGSLPSGERSLKRELIPCALDRCGARTDARPVMVGDTHFDAEGAAEMGIPFVGVLYGYGTRDELKPYHPVALAQDADALKKVLLGADS